MATPGVTFCDITAALVDPTGTSTTAVPYKSGFSADTVHPSARCVREGIAPAIWPILERVARKRLPRAALYTGQFHPTNSPDAEVLGGNSLMLGTSGAVGGSSNSNVAGTDSGGWNLIVSNGVTATPTIVTGADGFKKQCLTFGGTVGGGGGYAMLSLYAATNGLAINSGNSARLYDAEAMIDLVGVTGLFDISVAAAGVTTPMGSQGTSHAANTYPGSVTETLFYYTTYPLTQTGTASGMDIVIRFTAGTTPAGYAEIGRASVRRVAP